MAAEVQDMKAAELAVDSAEPDIKAGGLSFLDYVQVVAGAKELPASEVDANDIMMSILGADSLEEGLIDNQAEGLRNHIGEPFQIHDFRLNKSDGQYAEGGPVYAVIDAVLEQTGERVVLTTGSKNVLGGLGLVLKLNQWGQTFTTKQVDTPNGKAIKLVFVPPASVVKGKDGDPDF